MMDKGPVSIYEQLKDFQLVFNLVDHRGKAQNLRKELFSKHLGNGESGKDGASL